MGQPWQPSTCTAVSGVVARLMLASSCDPHNLFDVHRHGHATCSMQQLQSLALPFSSPFLVAAHDIVKCLHGLQLFCSGCQLMHLIRCFWHFSRAPLKQYCVLPRPSSNAISTA